MNRTTICECAGPGFCPRHRCNKTAFYITLCATKQEWFEKWEAGDGPCIHGTPDDGVEMAPLIPCRGAGDKLARGLRALRIDGPLKKAIRFFKKATGAKVPDDCGCGGRQQALNEMLPSKEE